MDFTANKSQQSDKASSIVPELQYFPNDKSDSDVQSQDYLLAFKKKDDANTKADEKYKTFKRRTKIVR